MRASIDGTNSATYSYLADSPLVSQITFAQSGTTRMTTTKQYDYLNRLTSISSANASATVLDSHGYAYNSANQRTRTTNADGTYWVYQYDALGQVISGVKYWSDGTLVAGQQFGYDFDTIGNRTGTTAGGDNWGQNTRSASYTANTLNQYTSRTVPGAVDITGTATNSATVTVNNQPTTRKGNYYWTPLAINNASSAVWQPVTNLAVLHQGTSPDLADTNLGHVFLPQSPEAYTYDLDGNLTQDGRWTYTWDSENRLIEMTSLSGAPAASLLKLDFAYDAKGRRIEKIVSTNDGTEYVPESTNLYVYDGWNLVAEVTPAGSLIRGYTWGLDLSGSMQGAGGVGGLLEISYAGSKSFTCYDGNGNVTALVNASNSTVSANYEYGPFGEVIKATGPMAKVNPFRFSTKYQDDETDLVCYGMRYLKTSSGGWLSRDPINEIGFKLLETGEGDGDDDIETHNMEGNPYRFVKNEPISRNDGLGLWPSASPWYGIFLNAPFPIPLTHENSDRRALPLAASDVGIVDAASMFVDNGQDTAQSYQHAMRAPGQSKAAARAAANAWVTQNLKAAQQNWCACGAMNHPVALWYFGLALHTVQDSTSPAHHGFQVWHGLAPRWWPADANHIAKEAWDPGAGSNLDKATAWLWSFMTCPSPPLPADYFIFNEDWNWWYD